MGMTPRQFKGVLVIVVVVAIFSIASSGMLTREMLPAAYAQETGLILPYWQVKTFVDTRDHDDALNQLAEEVALYLNGKDKDKEKPNKHAVNLRLFVAYRTSGVMVTLIYKTDTKPHYYKALLKRCEVSTSSTDKDRRGYETAIAAMLSNLRNISLYCAQDDLGDKTLMAILCEVEK